MASRAASSLFRLHEGETFALASGTVDDDGHVAHVAHVTVGAEELCELRVGGGVRQVADIDAVDMEASSRGGWTPDPCVLATESDN
jgi:hypothetical protein